VDGNSAITTINGGAGNDSFQFGQLYGSNPTAASGNVAPGDTIPAIDTTAGWVSTGISYSTTAYAGKGGDATFTVLSNKAMLSLFGGGGNNTFALKAFVLADGSPTTDYNVNAPVYIDAGSGYSTQAVVGTEAADTFVVTKDSVAGAGLNITYHNIAKNEIDGQGGNDIFDVLSTSPNTVTLLEGGTGSNTFNVAGDVTTPVVALNPDGTSGIINHSVASSDPAYNGIWAQGVPLQLANSASGQVVVGQPAGGISVVQDGAGTTSQTTYTISLGLTPPTPSTIWYLTVAPATNPSANPGTSVQVSTDGVNWSSVLVLTFDASAAPGTATAWNRTQTIYVRATSTTVTAGDQTIEIMTSLQSTTPISAPYGGFSTLLIDNVRVHVIDGDLPGLVVNQPSGGLNVLEGSATVVATYSYALTKAPAPGETVTVTLQSTDARLQMPAPLVFTAGNWTTPQTVTITAVNDGVVQGTLVSDVTASVSSSMATGGVYSAGVVDNPAVPITVYDANSAAVLVLQPSGQTVVSAGHPGTYTMQLTVAPTAPVTITLLASPGVTLSSSDPRFEATGGLNGLPAVVFGTGDTTAITITVTLDPGTLPPVGTQPTQLYPAQPHMLSNIAGPLLAEGIAVTSRSFGPAVMLPSEIAVPLPAAPTGNDTGPPLNTLNVFNDGDPANQTGQLGAVSSTQYAALSGLYSPTLAAGLASSQFGQLTGDGMGNGLTLSQGLPAPITYGGGTSYHNIDVIDVMLGTGADNYTVSQTVPNSITMVQGGGGYNTITATGGGGYFSPLLLMQSTTQNGQYYNSTTANITGWAREYQPPALGSGHGVLDASLDPYSVIMYGGLSSTFIYGGGGGDQIAGGSGPDQIYAGSGNDLIHANDGFNV
ncbi:MAG: beta strand repeat-containing protein, partial [Isosphaeraceae bacterium]